MRIAAVLVLLLAVTAAVLRFGPSREGRATGALLDVTVDAAGASFSIPVARPTTLRLQVEAGDGGRARVTVGPALPYDEARGGWIPDPARTIADVTAPAAASLHPAAAVGLHAVRVEPEPGARGPWHVRIDEVPPER